MSVKLLSNSSPMPPSHPTTPQPVSSEAAITTISLTEIGRWLDALPEGSIVPKPLPSNTCNRVDIKRFDHSTGQFIDNPSEKAMNIIDRTSDIKPIRTPEENESFF